MRKPFNTVLIRLKTIKGILAFACILLIPNLTIASNNTVKLLFELEATLEKANEYQHKKLQRIQYLKDELNATQNTENKRLEFELTRRLYEEYQSFVFDSAFKYAKSMIFIAQELTGTDHTTLTISETIKPILKH